MKTAKGTARILFIEDDPAVQHVVSQVLSQHYEVSSLSSCIFLPDRLRQYRPDLIILDIGLPWLNGFEICGDLRRDSLYRDVPILFLSALCSPEDIARGMKAGGDRYLTKPFDLEDLMAEVEGLLKTRR
jgi:DNA-binding response OmpR family regulator